ncbi:hypothetical protein FOZ63_016631, partial [Perkinsus olseni]
MLLDEMKGWSTRQFLGVLSTIVGAGVWTYCKVKKPSKPSRDYQSVPQVDLEAGDVLSEAICGAAGEVCFPSPILMTVSTGKVSSVAVPLQAASKKEILRQLKRFFISTNTAWTDRKGGGPTGEAKGRRRVEACVGESRADHPSGPQATDSGKAPQVKTTPG